MQRGSRRTELTKDDEGLLVGITLVLLIGVTILVDLVAGVSEETEDGQVCDPPCPAEGLPELAWLGLGGFVGVGSAECDAAGVIELEGGGGPRERPQGGGPRSPGHVGEGPGGSASTWGEGDAPSGGGQGHHRSHGSGRGSHCA